MIAHAPWAGRYGHTTVIDAAGAIYVLGGVGDSKTSFNPDFNDVWVSTDGGADRTRAGTRGILKEVRKGTRRVLHGT